MSHLKWKWFATSAVLLFGCPAMASPAAHGSMPPLLRTSELIDAASAAFGFCLGQEYSLDQTALAHPELAATVLIVKRVFDSRSGHACDALERRLKASVDAIDPAAWTNLRTQMDRQIRSSLRVAVGRLANRTTAEAFLEEVRQRSEGQLEPSIAATLVGSSEYFRAEPTASWPRWTRTWESKGNSKANGLEVRVRIPLAFEEGSPNATHMLRKWTQLLDADGTNVMLQLSVFPYISGESFESAVAEFSVVDPAEMGAAYGESLPDYRLLSSTKVTLLQQPAFLIEGEARAANLSFEATMHVQQAIAPTPYGVVALGCMVTTPTSSKSHLTNLFERYRPLCLQFFNSLTSAHRP
jgi:hypothetical protein